MKVKDAQKMEVDGVTGATFTSDAIKENIKLGLDYYKKHK
jgi:electron transport complex protein RnfG